MMNGRKWREILDREAVFFSERAAFLPQGFYWNGKFKARSTCVILLLQALVRTQIACKCARGRRRAPHVRFTKTFPENWFSETFRICLKKHFVKPQIISTHFYFHIFHPSSDWVEILWGFTKFFFKQILKVSAFYHKKKV